MLLANPDLHSHDHHVERAVFPRPAAAGGRSSTSATRHLGGRIHGAGAGGRGLMEAEKGEFQAGAGWRIRTVGGGNVMDFLGADSRGRLSWSFDAFM